MQPGSPGIGAPSPVLAAKFGDPALRQLHAAIDRAFTRRRSLLLLDLSSQVRSHELPWMAALANLGDTQADGRVLARECARELASLDLRAFPHTLMPNPLVRALANLDDAAQLGLPWVEELAADIFVGQLGAKFHHAARLAADLLGDSLYARYYELPFERVLALPEPTRPRKGPTLAPELLALAGALAGRDVGEREGSPSARNGVLLEHVQLLTTHNLATMLHPRGLDLRSALQAELGELALRSVEWIGERLRRDPGSGHWRPRLHMIKNVAYAWRQLIVLLSLADASEQAHVLARARASLPAWPAAWAGKFERVLLGLELVHAGRAIADEPRARRLLGWSLGRHWLLDHAA